MLTMVSIDATVGLNEELSRSLSLAREILELKFALESRVWASTGAAAKRARACQVFEHRSREHDPPRLSQFVRSEPAR